MSILRRRYLERSSDVNIRLATSPLTSQTIAETIAQHAMRNPSRPAIVGTQFAPFSIRELNLWIIRIGEQLRAAGIGRPASE